MQELIIINALQNDKKLSVKLDYIAFEAFCNNCNFDSQQCYIDWCCCWYAWNSKDNRKNSTYCWCNDYNVISRWCQCE